jgi:pimeloyl-ACP methyl ester carboxylesterase
VVTVLRSVAGEIASVLGHLLRYPTGIGRDWPATGEMLEREPIPIVLIPGLADNKSIFSGLRRTLMAQGCGPVVSFGYSPLVGDVRVAAAQLGMLVDGLRTASGAPRVHLVGHSLGGLIARYYVQRLGGHTRVDTVVAVATPHGGTLAAWLLAPVPLVRQLRPGSGLLCELAAPAPECTTRLVAFWSGHDELILPARHAYVEHADLTVRNVEVPGAGHLALAAHPRVVAEICRLLSRAMTPSAAQSSQLEKEEVA